MGSKKIDGYVAFLDILGFSELVRRKSFADDFDRYSEIISGAARSNDNLNYVTFSDSVVINTSGKSLDDLVRILQAVAVIEHQLLVNMDVPVRGCISQGRFSRTKSEKGDVMIAGPPIVEAVRYEEKQNWVGVILSPSVLKAEPAVKELAKFKICSSRSDAEMVRKELPWPFLAQRCYCIPFHSPNDFDENLFDAYVVLPHLPPRSESQEVLGDLAKYREKLDAMKLLAPDPSAQRKYSETSRWIGDVERQWDKASRGWDKPQN